MRDASLATPRGAGSFDRLLFPFPVEDMARVWPEGLPFPSAGV